MNQHKSLYNWLGLGVLALIALGLGYLTMSGRPEAESDESLPSLQLSPSSQVATQVATQVAATSPLAAPSQLTSPLSANLASPLPTQAPPTAEAPATSFELTVLHTNDTWGYLLPCG